MKRIGNQTFGVEKGCYIVGRGSLFGSKEKVGAYSKYINTSVENDKMGEETFEKSERKMLAIINKNALKDARLKENDIDLYLGGDLMNQLVSTNFVAEVMQIPFIGIYSACATITASLGLATCLIDGGAFKNVLCSAISHFSSAERQYRFPLEFGNQRQCYSQWTVTAGGGFVLSEEKSSIKISKVCFGRVQNFGVVDIANMGAAMAPAACDTLCNFFCDTNTKPNDYDFIATGDLGKLGSDILRALMEEKGYVISNIDATIIAQAPKMRPHIDTMRENIAQALGISADQVNVKATTEEGLGFTGTGEGISSQAICLLTSPFNLIAQDVQATGCAGCSGCHKA